MTIVEHDVDKVVREAFFPHKKDGVLVEVGAARPDFLSIGASYRAVGWKVIAIEPNPDFCAMHRALGHDVLQFACSDQDQDNVDFTLVDLKDLPHTYMGGRVSFESFSSLGIKNEFTELYKTVEDFARQSTIKVKARKLDTLLLTYHPEIECIDILAVDVEGWELNVLKGLDIARYRPKVLIIENYFKQDECGEFLAKYEYKLWRTLAPNDIYVSRTYLKFAVNSNSSS